MKSSWKKIQTDDAMVGEMVGVRGSGFGDLGFRPGCSPPLVCSPRPLRLTGAERYSSPAAPILPRHARATAALSRPQLARYVLSCCSCTCLFPALFHALALALAALFRFVFRVLLVSWMVV